MEVMSNKAGALKDLFKLMDVKGKNRIDACEIFACFTMMVTGEVTAKFGSIIDIFGTEKPNAIT
eukprot:CAMPEP_0114584904 /NCGR_PEP_ID=MMETSP0125-20121206/8540_1 /TAXON_ID=485358 ORGANISM="Aristerostoma sp., Strain ATCC 50986" /NCGR_SAMPLE_ID=MMETSP0125 /ASSEMBLY_ACC=CAM_ASM_000245 /LENGTH=63 /DNA_ID=CAMNT_0001779633 /DNA_START=182 /DNA_END=373 /DNA_ORIENTATION=-